MIFFFCALEVPSTLMSMQGRTAVRPYKTIIVTFLYSPKVGRDSILARDDSNILRRVWKPALHAKCLLENIRGGSETRPYVEMM